MSRTEILRACLGKPYREFAEGPDAFDCFGLACYLSRELWGLDVPRNYAGMVKARAVYQPSTVPNDGALVVMMAGLKHVGIWLARERGIIHAVEGRGVVFDSANALAMTGFGKPRYYSRKCNLPAPFDPSPVSMP